MTAAVSFALLIRGICGATVAGVWMHRRELYVAKTTAREWRGGRAGTSVDRVGWGRLAERLSRPRRGQEGGKDFIEHRVCQRLL